MNGRSMNAELIDRLEKSLVDSDDIKNLENTVAQLWEKIDLIKEILEMHDHHLGRTAQKSGLFAQFYIVVARTYHLRILSELVNHRLRSTARPFSTPC